ncbi:hypothetical protein LBMAG27_08000 [Bacteroidota bacterium]|nr:hypothetical protein LBMAG27_08000 [Bacteroidota bacterium]
METTLRNFFNDASVLTLPALGRVKVGQHNNSIIASLKIKINNKYMKTFTTDDLVRFVYNETTADESSAIKKAILENLDLAKTYQGMLTAKEELEQGKLNPSDSSIDIIMQYSRSTVKSTSHS